MRPRLLDAYCCIGGASKGYSTFFEVFGVDLFEDYPASAYPFPCHTGDAVAYIREHGHEYDAITASPPCQHASAGTRALRKQGVAYEALVESTRDALVASGKPWIMENVKGAALRNPTMLCGRAFGLGAIDDDGTPLVLDRHRLFEANFPLVGMPHPPHKRVQVAGVYGGARRDKVEARTVRRGGYVPPNVAVLQTLLGIDWTNHERSLYQAIPPAYTAYLGAQLLAEVRRRG